MEEARRAALPAGDPAFVVLADASTTLRRVDLRRFGISRAVHGHNQPWNPAVLPAIPCACQTCGHKPSNSRRKTMHSSGGGPQASVCNVSEEDRRQRAIRGVQREIDATSANVEIVVLSTVVRLHAGLWLYG